MEKSLKNKIVSIVSAVALVFCSLLAFVVPSITDKPQVASAYVGESSEDLRYMGTSVLAGGGSFLNGRPLTSTIQTPYAQGVYYFCSAAGSITSGTTLSTARVFTGSSLVSKEANSKIVCHQGFSNIEWSQGDSSFNNALSSISAPANTVYIRSNLQVSSNSPLVYNETLDFFFPRDFFHTGIDFQNGSFSSVNQIGFAFTIDLLYAPYSYTDNSTSYSKYVCKFYLPLSSIRGSDNTSGHIYIPFASVFSNGLYGDATYLQNILATFATVSGNKYVGYTIRTAICTQGSYLGGSLISPDVSNLTYTFACNSQMQMNTMRYSSILTITRVDMVDPDFHYGKAIVQAVNDFTDIEIGNGLSIKLLLIICVGLTLAVALIKMLI